MDTTRLATMLPFFVRELDMTRNRIQPLRLKLKDEEQKGNTADLRRRLDSELEHAPSLTFVPSWIRMIRQFGGRKLHASEIRRRTRDILDNPDYAPYRKGVLLEQIEGEIGDLHGALRALLTALEAVGVEHEELPVSSAEIGALYPQDSFSDPAEFSRELSLLDRHLRTVAEIAGSSEQPKLKTLQTNSFDVFVWSDLITGAKFIAIVFGILRAWREIEEIRKVRAEAQKFSAEATATLTRLEEERRESARAAVTRDLTSEIKTDDDARKNELLNAARHVVEFVEQRITMNVTFEVRSGPLPEAEGDEINETPAERAQVQAAKQIDEAGHVMAALEVQTPTALLVERSDLPAPNSR